MYLERKIREQEIRLPDKAMAALLGLSPGEYQSLSHRPLETLEDIHGNVLEYHIHISPNNEPHILNKLRVDRNNIVKLKPEEVHSQA
jgi:hypothetical protein